MNKAEFKKASADDIRALLIAEFEDPDNEFPTMTKKQMVKFGESNWADFEDLEFPEDEPEEVAVSPTGHPINGLGLDLAVGQPPAAPSKNKNLDLG